MKIFVTLFLTVLLYSTQSYAYQYQLEDDCDPLSNDNGFGCLPFDSVPIDGGAIALLVGGAALGYKALKKKKGESETEDQM